MGLFFTNSEVKFVYFFCIFKREEYIISDFHMVRLATSSFTKKRSIGICAMYLALFFRIIIITISTTSSIKESETWSQWFIKIPPPIGFIFCTLISNVCRWLTIDHTMTNSHGEREDHKKYIELHDYLLSGVFVWLLDFFWK